MRQTRNPRILIVTPEITYLPEGMGNMANKLTAKAGGLADVSASLVSALFELGADVHVALPHYRRMFNIDVGRLINEELRVYKSKLPDARIHLAEDRAFYYRDSVYSNYQLGDPRFALAFQREVINNIIPSVAPDLIHCNDWMTGLVPAMARRHNIPSLFTVHNIHTYEVTVDTIEDRGIDAAEFWTNLYFCRLPMDYEESRSSNPVDLLTSGIFAAHHINTVSPTFLNEIIDGQHGFIPQHIRSQLTDKFNAGCAAGILNAPDDQFIPATDEHIPHKFNSRNHREAKSLNKVNLQERLGLEKDENAPLFFWPSRLDPAQKGCQLLAHILYDTLSEYWAENMQVVMVANGAYQEVFHDIVRRYDLHSRVAVCDFREGLSHCGYAASNFMLMPSLYEPCGLPQMIGCIYGSLPVVHDTGGLHDTVEHLDVAAGQGNGFVFKNHDDGGIKWAIDEAMRFHKLDPVEKDRHISRIMEAGRERFSHATTARQYFDIYEKMLNRPLLRS